MLFELKRLKNDIYILSFDNEYDLGMHFLRMSEWREHPDHAGKIVPLVDFMEGYARDHENVFSYPNDWAGYNIPGRVAEEYKLTSIPDPNKYDYFMWNLFEFLHHTVGSYDFYVVGHVTGREGVVDHELAHAMYDRLYDYQEEMDELYGGLAESVRDEIVAALQRMGYASDVCADEAQAYLSTGLSDELQKAFKKKKIPKKVCKPFQKVFREYRAELDE